VRCILGGIDGIHDMGGMQGFGAVVVPGADAVFHEEWERRVFALSTLTGFLGLRRNNGRATREEMQPSHYLEASYYERWLYSTERGLLEAGTIAEAELEAWVDRLRAGEPAPARADPKLAARSVAAFDEVRLLQAPATARFAPGDLVRVRRMHPRGHTRSPRYLRGVVGVVEHVACEDRLPDVPGDAPVEPVYTLGFDSLAVFGELAEPPFTIHADLWQSYLEAVDVRA
jgi:nitrile hydratase beta subunit